MKNNGGGVLEIEENMTSKEERCASQVIFNKKKFSMVSRRFEEFSKELQLPLQVAHAFLGILADTIRFDPTLPTRSQEINKKIVENRKKKLAEANKSSYEMYGKKYYENNKEVCHERTITYKRAKRFGVDSTS